VRLLLCILIELCIAATLLTAGCAPACKDAACVARRQAERQQLNDALMILGAAMIARSQQVAAAQQQRQVELMQIQQAAIADHALLQQEQADYVATHPIPFSGFPVRAPETRSWMQQPWP
jgi:hypothetical protein